MPEKSLEIRINSIADAKCAVAHFVKIHAALRDKDLKSVEYLIAKEIFNEVQPIISGVINTKIFMQQVIPKEENELFLLPEMPAAPGVNTAELLAANNALVNANAEISNLKKIIETQSEIINDSLGKSKFNKDEQISTLKGELEAANQHVKILSDVVAKFAVPNPPEPKRRGRPPGSKFPLRPRDEKGRLLPGNAVQEMDSTNPQCSLTTA